MKKILFAFITFLAVGLVAGSAFAAATLDAGNTTLAAEKVGAIAYNATNVNTGFQPGGAVAASAKIILTLTNATFVAGTNVDICDGAGSSLGTGLVAAAPNNGSVAITLTLPIGPGTNYTFQTDGCVAFPNFLDNINVAPLTPAGATVTMATSGDPANANLDASATALTLVKQFSATLLPVTGLLSFGVTPQFSRFANVAPGTPPDIAAADTAEAALTIVSNESINDKVTVANGGGACKRILANGEVMNIKVSGSTLVVGEAFKYNGSNVAVAAADVAAGFKNNPVAAGNVQICRSTDAAPFAATAAQLVLPAPPVAIPKGNLTAQISWKGPAVQAAGSMGQDYVGDLITAGSAIYNIQLNAIQASIPYVSTMEVVQTTCIVDNISTLGADITADVLSSEGAIVQTGIALGNLAAKTTATITFIGQQIQLAGGAAQPVSVPANARYSAKLNFNAGPNTILINCIQTDPVAGPKRYVPTF